MIMLSDKLNDQWHSPSTEKKFKYYGGMTTIKIEIREDVVVYTLTRGTEKTDISMKMKQKIEALDIRGDVKLNEVRFKYNGPSA